MNNISKTKLLLAGLIAGAVAVGAGCSSNRGGTREGIEQPGATTSPTGGSDAIEPGTGGTGDDAQDPAATPPIDEEGTRETEPDVHHGTGGSDDTDDIGGAGDVGSEDVPPLNEGGNPVGEDPLNPGSPESEPIPDDTLIEDEGTREDPR